MGDLCSFDWISLQVWIFIYPFFTNIFPLLHEYCMLPIRFNKNEKPWYIRAILFKNVEGDERHFLYMGVSKMPFCCTWEQNIFCIWGNFLYWGEILAFYVYLGKIFPISYRGSNFGNFWPNFLALLTKFLYWVSKIIRIWSLLSFFQII